MCLNKTGLLMDGKKKGELGRKLGRQLAVSAGKKGGKSKNDRNGYIQLNLKTYYVVPIYMSAGENVTHSLQTLT